MTNDTPSFDFSQIGKRTPYTTPDGYMAQQEQTLLAMVGAQRATHRPWAWYAAAACAVVLLSIYPIMQVVNTTSAEAAPIYTQTQPTNNDWSEFAEADLFLENMNW